MASCVVGSLHLAVHFVKMLLMKVPSDFNCMAARQKSTPPAFLSFVFYQFPFHMPLCAT